MARRSTERDWGDLVTPSSSSSPLVQGAGSPLEMGTPMGSLHMMRDLFAEVITPTSLSPTTRGGGSPVDSEGMTPNGNTTRVPLLAAKGTTNGSTGGSPFVEAGRLALAPPGLGRDGSGPPPNAAAVVQNATAAGGANPPRPRRSWPSRRRPPEDACNPGRTCGGSNTSTAAVTTTAAAADARRAALQPMSMNTSDSMMIPAAGPAAKSGQEGPATQGRQQTTVPDGEAPTAAAEVSTRVVKAVANESLAAPAVARKGLPPADAVIRGHEIRRPVSWLRTMPPAAGRTPQQVLAAGQRSAAAVSQLQQHPSCAAMNPDPRKRPHEDATVWNRRPGLEPTARQPSGDRLKVASSDLQFHTGGEPAAQPTSSPMHGARGTAAALGADPRGVSSCPGQLKVGVQQAVEGGGYTAAAQAATATAASSDARVPPPACLGGAAATMAHGTVRGLTASGRGGSEGLLQRLSLEAQGHTVARPKEPYCNKNAVCDRGRACPNEAPAAAGNSAMGGSQQHAVMQHVDGNTGTAAQRSDRAAHEPRASTVKGSTVVVGQQPAPTAAARNTAAPAPSSDDAANHPLQVPLQQRQHAPSPLALAPPQSSSPQQQQDQQQRQQCHVRRPSPPQPPPSGPTQPKMRRLSALQLPGPVLAPAAPVPAAETARRKPGRPRLKAPAKPVELASGAQRRLPASMRTAPEATQPRGEPAGKRHWPWAGMFLKAADALEEPAGKPHRPEVDVLLEAADALERACTLGQEAAHTRVQLPEARELPSKWGATKKRSKRQVSARFPCKCARRTASGPDSGSFSMGPAADAQIASTDPLQPAVGVQLLEARQADTAAAVGGAAQRRVGVESTARQGCRPAAAPWHEDLQRPIGQPPSRQDNVAAAAVCMRPQELASGRPPSSQGSLARAARAADLRVPVGQPLLQQGSRASANAGVAALQGPVGQPFQRQGSSAARVGLAALQGPVGGQPSSRQGNSAAEARVAHLRVSVGQLPARSCSLAAEAGGADVLQAPVGQPPSRQDSEAPAASGAAKRGRALEVPSHLAVGDSSTAAAGVRIAAPQGLLFKYLQQANMAACSKELEQDEAYMKNIWLTNEMRTGVFSELLRSNPARKSVTLVPAAGAAAAGGGDLKWKVKIELDAFSGQYAIHSMAAAFQHLRVKAGDAMVFWPIHNNKATFILQVMRRVELGPRAHGNEAAPAAPATALSAPPTAVAAFAGAAGR
ncbi:hypothetical protein PLESTB_000733200 [Pleodorina starrii]|uniref:Uncharacterized protein n=1 Tax=Pleodorina starrii TaxID=330485 RepID=A0A9W6BJL8_9CHLO|nr:hypothetical protein PLESTB_000733200 [Pleodorina starrii]